MCMCVRMCSSLVLSLSDVLSNTGKNHFCLNSTEVSVMSSWFLSFIATAKCTFATTQFPCSPRHSFLLPG